MSGFLDITLPVTPGMAVWPGSPAVEFNRRLTLEADGVEDTSLVIGAHTGTHLDAPSHFIPGGLTVDRIDPRVLVGPAWVAEVEGAELITGPHLDALGIPAATKRLLLKANRGARRTPPFEPAFTALDDSAAEWVADRGMVLFGIDALSVEPFGGYQRTHGILLGAGVILLEGLNLDDASPGPWELICLPLRLAGVEAAPVRAFLRRQE